MGETVIDIEDYAYVIPQPVGDKAKVAWWGKGGCWRNVVIWVMG